MVARLIESFLRGECQSKCIGTFYAALMERKLNEQPQVLKTRSQDYVGFIRKDKLLTEVLLIYVLFVHDSIVSIYVPSTLFCVQLRPKSSIMSST